MIHNKILDHKNKIEALYQHVKYPEAIDWWAAHYAYDELDVAISNARHLDPARQLLENSVWERIVPAEGRILDLGCGRGFFSGRLHRVMGGKVSITGMDVSSAILKLAQSEHSEIDFVQGFAEVSPFKSGTFDVVLVISTFEHVVDPRPVIEEIARILRPRGYLYLCLHRPFLDPFIFPQLARLSFRGIKSLALKFGTKNLRKAMLNDTSIGYIGTLRQLRRNLEIWLSESGFHLIESRTLLHQFEWKLYKSLVPWAVPGLIRFGRWLNRLPLSYYKNLEYWLLRKP